MRIGRNLLPLMTCLGMRNLLRSSMDGLVKEQCRYAIHYGGIFLFLFLFCTKLTGEESFDSSLGIL